MISSQPVILNHGGEANGPPRTERKNPPPIQGRSEGGGVSSSSTTLRQPPLRRQLPTLQFPTSLLHGFLADLDTAAFADDAGEAATSEVRGAIAAPVEGGAWCPTPSQPATVSSAIVTTIRATTSATVAWGPPVCICVHPLPLLSAATALPEPRHLTVLECSLLNRVWGRRRPPGLSFTQAPQSGHVPRGVGIRRSHS